MVPTVPASSDDTEARADGAPTAVQHPGEDVPPHFIGAEPMLRGRRPQPPGQVDVIRVVLRQPRARKPKRGRAPTTSSSPTQMSGFSVSANGPAASGHAAEPGDWPFRRPRAPRRLGSSFVLPAYSVA